jgi:hypothetical protein
MVISIGGAIRKPLVVLGVIAAACMILASAQRQQPTPPRAPLPLDPLTVQERQTAQRGVLIGFARLDVVHGDPALGAPVDEDLREELGAVVDPDGCGWAMKRIQLLQHANDVRRRNRGPDLDRLEVSGVSDGDSTRDLRSHIGCIGVNWYRFVCRPHKPFTRASPV